MERIEIAEYVVTDEKGFYIAKIGEAILKLNDKSLEKYYAQDIIVTIGGNDCLSYADVKNYFFVYNKDKENDAQANAFFNAIKALKK